MGGVFVKDMEMPESCSECCFAMRSERRDACHGDYDFKVKIMYGCKLKPEGIEDGWVDMSQADKERQSWCPLSYQLIFPAEEMLPNDVQKNVKGEWIVGDNSLTCPICGAKGEDIKSDFTFNYCPNCGARMENKNDIS